KEFMRDRDGGRWTGTATALLAHLNDQVDDRQYASKAWPKAPNALSSRLTRIAPELRRSGIDILKGSTGDDRTITILAQKAPERSSGSSGSSEALPHKGFSPDDPEKRSSGDRQAKTRDRQDRQEDRQARNIDGMGITDDPDDPDDLSRSYRG